MMEKFAFKNKDKFSYIELGPDNGEIILLLHGLFGTASNFDATMEEFQDRYKIYLPLLPIFDMSVRQLSVYSLMEYVNEFTEFFKIDKFHVVGNSLGGHLALRSEERRVGKECRFMGSRA